MVSRHINDNGEDAATCLDSEGSDAIVASATEAAIVLETSGSRAGSSENVPFVLAAMSGGVDSSVVARLLVDEGYRVAGITMKLFDADDLATEMESTCCSLDDVEDAKAVCRSLGISHYTLNFKGRFSEFVIDRFCDAYLCGRTPNPCIDCNRFLKFEALQRRRRELGADFVATGHYARRRYDVATGRWQLLRAADPAKDQSYVLYHVSQEDLAHMMFPLGELAKPEVRELARASAFGNAEKSESQDICFVPDGDYVAFIAKRTGTGTPSEKRSASDGSAASEESRDGSEDGSAAFREGDIVDTAGRKLGRHNGLVHFTIGQRKGIGVAAAEPLYVLAKDVERNELVVGFKSALSVSGLVAHDVNFVSVASFERPMRVQVKTHYRQRPVDGVVEQTGDDELTVAFDEPVASPAPGQAVVIYDGDVVCAGATIDSVIRTDNRAE